MPRDAEPPLRLSPPPLPAPPTRPPFPLAATLAPVIVAGVIWALTQSMFALLFAALGPVVALASLLDGARQRRRGRREHAALFDEAMARLEQAVDDEHRERRRRRAEVQSDPSDPSQAGAVLACWRELPNELVVVLGHGRIALDLDEPAPSALGRSADSEQAAARWAVLRERAAVLDDAPVVADAAAGVAVHGAAVASRAIARSIALQLACRLSPARARVRAPVAESWALLLPHPVTTHESDRFEFELDAPGDPARGAARAIVVEFGDARAARAAGVVIEAGGDRDPAVLCGADGEVRSWSTLTRVEAGASARALARLAHERGIVTAHSGLPDRVELASLLADEPGERARSGTGPWAVPIGRSCEAVVTVDLVREGPHALVVGTTGSGKSEALISWVLALAASHAPQHLAFVLIDFKGGSAFEPLRVLPHVAGIVSDLDAPRARRAMLGLRTELLRRERVLAAHRARSIDELPDETLPRLVVVVDEYAVVVAEHPELHEVFGDLAARGRSLGVHLVLCTQRPAGVVRNAILANVALRIALRMADRAEATAVLGGPPSIELAAAPPGRAVIASAARTHAVQLARSDAADIATVVARWPLGVRTPQPWSDPLPARLARSRLAPAAGWVFGLRDLVDEQRHESLAYRPERDGALLIVGAAGSGRSTALASLVEAAEVAGDPVVIAAQQPAEAWAQIEGEVSAPPGAVASRRLIVVDDVDRLLAALGAEHAGEFVARLALLARRSRAHGLGLALTATRLDASLHALANLADTRVLLRQAGRDEHLLAGLPSESFDPRSPPGAGVWHGDGVQIAGPDGARAELLAARPLVPVAEIALGEGGLAVATTRPRAVADEWRGLGVRVRELGGSAADESLRATAAPSGEVIVADPDAWQAEWALLATARRELSFLVDPRIGAAELRALTRCRELPPPLGDGEWWCAWQAEVRRVRLRLPTP